jgi:pyruvate dehydrogenase E2 component (dihydrolipoamide acetyltransferase)
MALVIRMPKMSDTMQKGIVSSWLKKVGDEVKAGEIFAEIETDKAIMELESEESGVILYLAVEEKQSLEINNILAIIGNIEEDIESIVSSLGDKKEDDSCITHTNNPKQSINHFEKKQISLTTPSSNDRLMASPLARKVAKDNNIKLESIVGSGDSGRIIKRDLDKVINTAINTRSLDKEYLPITEGESFTDMHITPIRSIIAKKLAESKKTVPHFYLTINIDVDKILKTKAEINEHSSTKISFNDIVIKATSMAVRQNMKVNASWHDTFIRYNDHINIGIAVAIADGIVVPVIRFADTKPLSAIAEESKLLQKKASNNKISPLDIQGSTFTISNLGMYDVESFCAIISPPEACILAIGTIQQIPVVKNNNVVIGHTMKVTLSCDHRVVDGAVGAAFLKSFKKLLENPYLMLV